MKEVAEVIQKVLTLLGSASAYISSFRRRKILTELNPNLQDLIKRTTCFKIQPLCYLAVAKKYS